MSEIPITIRTGPLTRIFNLFIDLHLILVFKHSPQAYFVREQIEAIEPPAVLIENKISTNNLKTKTLRVIIAKTIYMNHN